MKRSRMSGAGLAAVLAVLLSPLSAQASCGTPSDPLVLSATSVAFGVYMPNASAPDAANGSITAACLQTFGQLPSFTVGISSGLAQDYSPRRMISGSAYLNYNLYTNPTHTAVWGDGTAGTLTQTYGGKQSSVSFVTYGQIPAAQSPAAGDYSDITTVTITY